MSEKGKKQITFTFNLSEKRREWLDEMAKLHNMPIGSLINQWLDEQEEKMEGQKNTLVNFRVNAENKKRLDLLLMLKDVGVTEFFTNAILENWQSIESEGGIDSAIEKYQEAKAKERRALQSAFEKLTNIKELR